MPTRALFPIAAIFLVIGIFLWSNLFRPSPWIGKFAPGSSETNVLTAMGSVPDTAAEVALTVEIPKQSNTLPYGTQAEVLRFTLRANGPYTLRYLTVQVEATGLKLLSDWKVYEVNDGQVDFTEIVGAGENQVDAFLRLRLFSSRSAAYLGQAGEQEFVLLASVLKNSAGESSSLFLSLPADLSKEVDWAWLPGNHGESWLSIGESLGAGDVLGLPTKTIQKD